MCIYYALKLWKEKGGNLLFQFRPSFHVMVCSETGIWHGTNDGGKWHIERINARAFARWLSLPKKSSK